MTNDKIIQEVTHFLWSKTQHLFYFCRKQNRHDCQLLFTPSPIVIALSFDYSVGGKAHEYVPKFSLRAQCSHMKCSFMNTPAQVRLNKDHQIISSSKCVRTFSSSGAIITAYLDIVASAVPHFSEWQWGLRIVWVMLMWLLWFTTICRLFDTCVIVGLNNGWCGLFSAKISIMLLQVSYGSSLHITIMFVMSVIHMK